MGRGASLVSGARGFALDLLARNQRAHRIADCVARSVSPGIATAGFVFLRLAQSRNSVEVPRFRRWSRREVHERKATNARSVCANGREDSRPAAHAPFAR